MIERDAEEAGSPLPCQPLRPKPRRAVPAAEWVWSERRAFPKNNEELFAAQFVLGEAVDEPVADKAAGEGTARGEVHDDVADGNAAQGVEQREIIEHDSVFQTRLRGWLNTD